MIDPESQRDLRSRLQRAFSRKRDVLAEDLRAYRSRGPLASLLRECKLGIEHFQVLALLLHRHFSADEPACEGRVILANVFDSSFDVLSGAWVLHETGPLRAHGLVVIADAEDRGVDALDARFVLAPETLIAFRDEVQGGAPEDQRRPHATGYANQRELLVDLRILHNLYRLRSERVFNQDRWNRVHHSNLDPAQSMTRRLQRFWARIRTRLEATANAREFPVLRFVSEHGLQEEETVVVVHLLFKELYEGNAYADAAEMLRLVSASEADLIRNRRLFLRSGSLVAHDILHLEPMIENRELTAEVYLQDWAVTYLLGAPAERTIGTDERLDWHLYLKNLTDARLFFRDLDAN